MPLLLRRLRAAHALFVFVPVAGIAQQSAASEFRIEVKSDQPVLSGYTCQLDEYASRRRFGIADLRADGVCSFRGVPFGDYHLAVMDARNNVVHEDVATVSQHAPSISVELPKTELPPAGPVSIAQLQHPPTRRAYSAVRSAQRFSQAGDYRRAAEMLQKAVSLSPYYADAHWNLAAQYIRLGDYARSVEESRRAMELDKPGAPQLCNLAYAQMQLKQYPEAMESVRASLGVDNSYAQSHLVLGVLLARDIRTLPESIPHLEVAARSLPSGAQILELVRRTLAKKNAQDAQ